MTRILNPSSYAVIDGDDTKITGGRLTLDSYAVPYGSADLDFPIETTFPLEDVDPRDDTRVVISGAAGAGAGRLFDLGLRSRVLDHSARTLTLRLETDEALLIDYAPLTDDTGARAFESSLRDVVDYVLSKIGAALAPGSVDEDLTAAWDVENRVINPSGVGTTGYTVDANVSNIDNGTSNPAHGTSYLRFAAAAAGNARVLVGLSSTTVTPGQRVSASAVIRAGATGQYGTMSLRFKDDRGTVYGTGGNAVELSAVSWTPVDVTAIVPDGASVVEVLASVNATAASVAFALDKVLFVADELVPWFDGSLPDDGLFRYEWSGPANTSASRRTAIVERSPDLYVWRAGLTAWDFLSPLTTLAGARLFCDERRVWQLINPEEYRLPGFKPYTPDNVTAATDTIGRDDPAVFATGVVVRYAWNDGVRDRTAVDSAGTPDVVVVFDVDRPYPGPGTAAAILARRDGTGRTQAVTALADWAATPAQTASINLPDTPEQRGLISRVSWDLGSAALMDVDTRGLVDVPPDSWLAVPPGEAWQDPPALSWAEW